MQRRKIAIASLSLLLVGLSLSIVNLPRAHAFTSGHNSLAVSGVLISGNLPPGVPGNMVGQGGTSLTITATVQGSFFTPSYQRNITIGFKGDWMQNYQNATIFTLSSGQIVSTSLTVSIPSTSGISPSHSWNVQIWDGPSSGNVANCTPGDADNNPGSGVTKSCFSLGGGTITILTSDQYAASQARNNAETVLGSISFLSNPAATAQVDQANAELSLGDQSWSGGDFAGAKTHYQNAQSDANGALATAYNLNGGQGNSAIYSPLLSAIGIVMFGLGGLLAGLGGFFYLRRRPKT
ncbi:MAG TPA: hypothetical protein VFE96_04640 [Candidatus Bathyarchaeia archaeon]|nr:hypothetical protein [Candidatus Bathyarchaeia archaeon]